MMKNYWTIACVIIVIVIFGYLFSVFSFQNQIGRFSQPEADRPLVEVGQFDQQTADKLLSDNRQPKTDNNSVHPLLFYDEQAFLRATQTAHPFITQPLKGAIIPHHLVASDNIANLFKTIQPSNYKTIVLIGPNHYEKGNSNIVTSRKPWQTPFGTVYPDAGYYSSTVYGNVIPIDEDVLEHDHAVAGLMPFIAYYTPHVKVIPILLKYKFSIADADKLATTLSGMCHSGECPFFFASVDFSHYLPKEIANQKDEITKNAIESKNYEALSKMGSDYLDSPPSIIVLMKIMEKLSATNMQIFAHTNSADYPNADQKSTTSHFVVGF